MFITAMYLYGVSQHAWGFSWFYGFLGFVMDLILVVYISPSIIYGNSNNISDEEKDYWRKKWEVEELRRKLLDKKIYG